MTYKKITITATVGLIALSLPTNVFAATIRVSPFSGSLVANRTNSIEVTIDDTKDVFNAAQASVTLSENLTVTDLIMGDCNFSFIKTPGTQDPSFVGVSLGSSMKKCTVYTLNVIPSGSDPATITISDGSVKKAGDAQELLTGVQNASFKIGTGNIGEIVNNFFVSSAISNTIVPVTDASTTPLKSSENLDSYSVEVKVYDKNNKPVKNSIVTLEPQLASKTDLKEVKTNNEGVAEFKGVTANTYTVRAKSEGEVLAEQIINAQGQEPVLVMGLKDEKPAQNPWIAIVSVIVVVAIAGLTLRRLVLGFLRK